MSYPLDDTIAAVSSPPGGAARGIIRLSGPDGLACVTRYFKPRHEPAVQLHSGEPAVVDGTLQVPGVNSTVPCDLYLWPDGRSYTGQPAAEIHTLGCPPLLEKIVAELCAAGARPARAGEFTLRAFLAGRLDLTQAEAVLGVIDAADPDQLDVALAQLAGGLATPLGKLRDSLVELLAHLEAGFDFADEDLPFIDRGQLEIQLAEAGLLVDRLARQMNARNESNSLARAVLVGRPNTGKSSLFNALAEGPGALVSSLPGTTRDYVTAELDLVGVKCLLVDTAGVDAAPESALEDPEFAAQAAASEQTGRADIELFCLDSSRPLDGWEMAQIGEDRADRVLVLTKTDLGNRVDALDPAVATSSHTGDGIEPLREQLRRTILENVTSGEVVRGTALRCRRSLELAAESLDRARRIVQDAPADTAPAEELVAAEVRLALDEIGQVVGTVYTDDVLGRVFSRFCVGK